MKWPSLSVEGSIIGILGAMGALIVLLLARGTFSNELAGTMNQNLTTIIGIFGGYLGSKIHKQEQP